MPRYLSVYSDLVHTALTVRGSKCDVGEISASVQTGSRAHPVTYAVGTGYYTEVKRQGLGIDQPPISSVEIKERVGLYVLSPSGPSEPVLR